MMKSSQLTTFGCVSLLFASFHQCKTEKTRIAALAPPLQTINVPADDFVLNAEEEITLQLESGTTIRIPSSAFEDKNHHPLKGNVKITFREFHSAADIILSGIPMTYDSAGVRSNFESAGMFQIDATDESNEKVFLQKNKSISINLASFKEGNYNFYFFDSLKGNWDYMGNRMAIDNPLKKEIQEKASIVPVKPEMYKRYDKSAVNLNMNFSYYQFPELSGFEDVVWRYAGNNARQDPEKNQWIYNESWYDVNLQHVEKMIYKITLTAYQKTFETLVEPTLSPEDYAAAEKNFAAKMQEYNVQLAAVNEAKAKADRQAEILRSFSISQMGIYNWDRQMKQPNVQQLAAAFKIDGKEVDIEGAHIFLVINNTNVVKYNKYDVGQFAYSRMERNKIIIVMPDERIAVFREEEFLKLDTEVLSKLERPSYTFPMKTIGRKIASAEDFNKFVLSI